MPLEGAGSCSRLGGGVLEAFVEERVAGHGRNLSGWEGARAAGQREPCEHGWVRRSVMQEH